MDWKRLFFGKGGSLTPTFDNLISKRAEKVIITILGAFAVLFNALAVYFAYTDEEELSEIYSDNFILYMYTNALVVLILYVVGVYLLWGTKKEKLGFFCVMYFYCLWTFSGVVEWVMLLST